MKGMNDCIGASLPDHIIKRSKDCNISTNLRLILSPVLSYSVVAFALRPMSLAYKNHAGMFGCLLGTYGCNYTVSTFKYLRKELMIWVPRKTFPKGGSLESRCGTGNGSTNLCY